MAADPREQVAVVDDTALLGIEPSVARSRCGNGSATKPPTPSATELSLAPAHGRAGPLPVGAEDGARTDAVLTCVLDVANRGLGDRLGEAVQANLRRSPANAKTLTGPRVHVRSVKCAYVEATDVTYVRLAFRLAAAGTPWSMATHTDDYEKRSCWNSDRRSRSSSSWRPPGSPRSRYGHLAAGAPLRDSARHAA